MSYRRLLTLDGGGIKGVFAASFLATLEDQVDAPIGNYFDLISGTSTGGIIALALGLGIPASDILKMYQEWGTTVFEGENVWGRLRHFFRRKYNSLPLQNALCKVFGDHTLGDSRLRLVIPSFNLQTGTVHIYKTSHHPRLTTDYKEKMTTVALATSAAPTYFPPHRPPSGITLIDGGMWANNPIAVAIIEAICVLGWERNSLRVLSLGCTREVVDVSGGSSLWSGKFYWAGKVADLFLAGQSSGALGMAEWLVGRENLYRVNETVPGGAFSLDGVQRIGDLRGLGAYSARFHAPRICPEFLSAPAESFRGEQKSPRMHPGS
jgi:hypothetical protein